MVLIYITCRFSCDHSNPTGILEDRKALEGWRFLKVAKRVDDLVLKYVYVWSHIYMYGHHIQESMDRPGKVANPARGQLSRENEYFSVRVRA